MNPFPRYDHSNPVIPFADIPSTDSNRLKNLSINDAYLLFVWQDRHSGDAWMNGISPYVPCSHSVMDQ